MVWVHGEADGVAALRQVWDESKNIQPVEDLTAYGDADLEVEVTSTAYSIHDRRSKKHVVDFPVKEENANLIVIEILGKMVNWERIIHMQNEKSALKDWFNFEIDVARATMEDIRHPFLTIKNPETIIKADNAKFLEKDGALISAFIPYIRSLKKPKQKLYFYLLHLRSNYAISCYEGEYIYRPEEHQYARSLQIPLLKNIKAWGLGPEEQETTSYFKLLVTTEALGYQQLLQDGIDGKLRADLALKRVSPFRIKNDWYCVTFKVGLERT